MKEITSLQNEHVKYWNNLKNKKFRDQEKKFIIEGDHLINEAKKNNIPMETSGLSDDCFYKVTKDILKKISNQVSISDNIAVLPFLKEKEIKGNILILDNLQDPGNLGTIIRSSVAFNMPNIVLSNESVDLYNDKVIRSTEGMIFNTNVLRKDLKTFIPYLKKIGYEIIGTDVKRGKRISDIKNKKIAIIIGNEGNGISDDIKKLCDSFINIKMDSKCESLNAGVCASIIMYEVNND